MSTWTDEYLHMIEDCFARESRIDEWSRNFLESLNDQILKGRHPSEKQVAKLEQIWEQATARG